MPLFPKYSLGIRNKEFRDKPTMRDIHFHIILMFSSKHGYLSFLHFSYMHSNRKVLKKKNRLQYYTAFSWESAFCVIVSWRESNAFWLCSTLHLTKTTPSLHLFHTPWIHVCDDEVCSCITGKFNVPQSWGPRWSGYTLPDAVFPQWINLGTGQDRHDLQ